ncbi:MAG TPA: VOC family protein, partial [Tepidiformaceae bacterium]|nr:VOC family protein [Tepidiformaceae bacterium]
MVLAVTKDSIDLGIIVSDGAKALAFYRDTLGLEPEGDMPMPGGGTMHRLRCGTSTIKVIEPAKQLEAKAPPGGIQGAYGYRYWTISVADLEGLTRRCADAGYRVAVPVTALRPGIRISIVEDPDGNWV